jgi:NFU1 iron-sulfur cluster scaffold homolog, mitochondrial
MPVVVSTSPTPNPHALKFVMDAMIARTPVSFERNSANSHPLATALFEIPGVHSIFLIGNVITVSLYEGHDWDENLPDVSLLLEEYAESEAESLRKPPENPIDEQQLVCPEDFFALELEMQLEHLNLIMDVKVRPGLAGDGGGLDIVGIDGKRVLIYYLGACGTCPSSTAGTLSYIQNMIQTFAHRDLEVELEE